VGKTRATEYQRQDQGDERVWVVPSQKAGDPSHRSVLVIGINGL